MSGPTDAPTRGTRTALVLGGGGITGIAWELGLVAGLADAGVDLTTADLVVGTSAGSIVGAQLRSGLHPDELYQRQLRDPAGETVASISRAILLRLAIPYLLPGNERVARANVGRLAIAAETVPEQERRRIIALSLPSEQWPDRPLLVTAVDALTGDAVAFRRAHGVPLLEAVAASCAVPLVWPPITVAGRPYVDGGLRSPVNADLAAGYDRVVVIAPVTISTRRNGRISRQLAGLGPHVRSVLVSPDDASQRAIGGNVLDPMQRPGAARAGRRQAAAAVDDVAAVWSG